jgi:hypothetical protein
MSVGRAFQSALGGWRIGVMAVLLLGSISAYADTTEDEEAALFLADIPTEAPVKPRNWNLNLEAAAIAAKPRTKPYDHNSLLALDGKLDQALTSNLRAVVSARAEGLAESDVDQAADQDLTQASIKEGYLSWQPQTERLVEFGRINVRNGVGIGSNPTDFFREGAYRTLAADPETRRKYRVGSVMLRGQQLWNSGALSIQYSPELSKPPEPWTDPTAADDLSRTNNRERWLLTLSQQVSANLRPQWLLYQAAGESPQLGFNINRLFGSATLVYAEWAGGRARPIGALAELNMNDEPFIKRNVLGLTYTFPIDLSVSVERHNQNHGVNALQSQSLAMTNPQAWGQTLRLEANQQQAVSKSTWFVYVSARNVGRPKLDLSGFIQTDRPDQGHQLWLELRQRLDNLDVAAQWQEQTGDAWTRFGASPDRRSVRLMVEYYF